MVWNLAVAVASNFSMQVKSHEHVAILSWSFGMVLDTTLANISKHQLVVHGATCWAFCSCVGALCEETNRQNLFTDIDIFLYLCVFQSLCPVLAAGTRVCARNEETVWLRSSDPLNPREVSPCLLHTNCTYTVYTFTYVMNTWKIILPNCNTQLRWHAECKYWFSTR